MGIHISVFPALPLCRDNIKAIQALPARKKKPEEKKTTRLEPQAWWLA
jgi:hypothetical protein